jgi:hypothetical protein
LIFSIAVTELKPIEGKAFDVSQACPRIVLGRRS